MMTVLIGGRGKRKSPESDKEMSLWRNSQRGHVAGFEDGAWGHKPRNVGSL